MELSQKFCRWYVGIINRKDAAIQLVTSQKYNIYLVRKTEKKGYVKLSVYSRHSEEDMDEIHHYKILNNKEGFFLEGHSPFKLYHSVEELVQNVAPGATPVLKFTQQ